MANYTITHKRTGVVKHINQHQYNQMEEANMLRFFEVETLQPKGKGKANAAEPTPETTPDAQPEVVESTEPE